MSPTNNIRTHEYDYTSLANMIPETGRIVVYDEVPEETDPDVLLLRSTLHTTKKHETPTLALARQPEASAAYCLYQRCGTTVSTTSQYLLGVKINDCLGFAGPTTKIAETK